MRSIRIEFLPGPHSGQKLRLFGTDGQLVDDRAVDAEALEALLHRADTEYRLPITHDLASLGQALYRFLDGEERWLTKEREASRKSLQVRIDVKGRLSHLPWELLHDGETYLCPLPHGALLPVRQVGKEEQPRERANRALRLFFMACDPIDGGASLSYEEEEARILEATRKSQLELEVEESGSLEGLKERWDFFGTTFFDVLHLTGHAVSSEKHGPVFLMEDDEGYQDPVTPERLFQVFGEIWPRLIFLSGCETSKAPNTGALPSFCEALVQAGAPAVLGWALKVYDDIAILAAQQIYEALSASRSHAEALIAARAAISKFEQDSSRIGQHANWHRLRLYGDGTPLEPYVTSQAEGRVKFAPRPPADRAFLDAQTQEKEICSRDRFVGRRRFVQRGLRTLRARADSEHYAEGLLLLGMGGLGKTSLAVRLCERLRHRRLVNVGWFDEAELLRLLSSNLESPAAIKTLQQPGLPFATRLRKLLEDALHQKPAIIVLDDFEDNVELEADQQTPRRDYAEAPCRLQTAPLEALATLLKAIRDTGSNTRVLIPCRYDFEIPGPAALHTERLSRLRPGAGDSGDGFSRMGPTPP